jgi:phosphoenolpyruvate carboxykinase (ATP)
LIAAALQNGEGVLTDTGALMCDTGKFTGRSPKDKFLVCDDKTENTVWWGDVNFNFTPEKFDALLNKMLVFLEEKRIYVRQAFAGANADYRLSLEIINTQAWHNLFCNNMFIRPTQDDITNFSTDFTIICVPEFEADPGVDGTRQANFTIVDMTRRILLIGGTGYAGEMK